VPQVIFTAPEVATVGLTSAEAAGAGRSIRVVDYELGKVAGAKLFEDGYSGKARMVVDEDRKTMIGATLAGPGVGARIWPGKPRGPIHGKAPFFDAVRDGMTEPAAREHSPTLACTASAGGHSPLTARPAPDGTSKVTNL